MTRSRAGRRTTTPVITHGDKDTRDGPRERAAFPIVGIGASAEGLEAFSALLKNLPVNTGMGFVLLQHLDPEHDSALTQLLGRATTLPVHEVTDNLRVEPNHVYVIPPNKNPGISAGVLTLAPRPETRTPHRSAPASKRYPADRDAVWSNRSTRSPGSDRRGNEGRQHPTKSFVPRLLWRPLIHPPIG